ncbi:hypothetical protein IWX90DRAFT_254601 [Phyllosticta citrichinensis]|uniref:G-protein coupled receptors family 2 profile 2 domain-containing protein n=1 Tax=Phyllosticta citrichinensis TaxID=1130410 RepID=A0ABR1XRI6_9PEZI
MSGLANCPPPFLNRANFGDGGYTSGRLCANVSDAYSDLECCLPCPITDWIFSDSFESAYKVTEALNLVGLIGCLFLLVSWLFLPVANTRRHYLSVCLVVGCVSLALGFAIPLGAQPEQCFDEITPNDMHSSVSCAFSGTFIVAGGLSAAMWIFIRALSMHVQICWDATPGRKFFYASQFFGWGIPAILFATTMAFTGVSFRFGTACHVSLEHSMADFWGPLLGIAGAAALTQLGTFCYCINVYLKNMWSDDQTETQDSTSLPSYTGSLKSRKNSAKIVYRRVSKVLWLQWRGILIVLFVLVDVIFFSVVFVYLDQKETTALHYTETALPLIRCLMDYPYPSSGMCTGAAQGLSVNQGTATATLVLLSVLSIQCFLLLGRWSMFTGWVGIVRSRCSPKREFVSLDARGFSKDTRAFASDRAFELIKVPQSNTYVAAIKAPETAVLSPEELYGSPISSSDGGKSPDYLGSEHQRQYLSPVGSFSTPRAPSTAGSRDSYDPYNPRARGGLGLHPVYSESFDDFPTKF